MKSLRSRLGLIVLAILVAVLAAFQRDDRANRREESALRYAAHKAQAEGLASISISTPLPNFREFTDLDDALRSQAVLVVRVEGQTSVPSPAEDCIWTWYKLRVLQDLSRTPLSKDAALPTGISFQIPANVVPLKDDEIVLRNLGGSIQMEGVTVKSKPLYGGFASDITYLVFADLSSFGTTQSVSHYGEIALGPAGIFTIDSNDQIHALLSDSSESPIARDLHDEYGNSLQRLSEGLRK